MMWRTNVCGGRVYFQIRKNKDCLGATAYTNKDLKKLRVRAGLNRQFSFHSARYSWAVRALQTGMRIEYASLFASVKNTEVYTNLDCELDRAMEIFNE